MEVPITNPSLINDCFQQLLSNYLGDIRPLLDRASERPRKVRRTVIAEKKFPEEVNEFLEKFPDVSEVSQVSEQTIAILILRCGANAKKVDFLLSAAHHFASKAAFSWDSFIPLFLRTLESIYTPNTESPTSPFSSGFELLSFLEGSSLEVPRADEVTASSTPTNPEPIWLRQVACRVLISAVDHDRGDLSARTCLVAFGTVLLWVNEGLRNLPGSSPAHSDAVYSCLKTVRRFTEASGSLIPFYALFHFVTKLESYILCDDMDSLSFLAHVASRRDSLALLLTSLDSHLQCPSFCTLRPTLMTYHGTLGEPLQGQDATKSIPLNSLEHRRAIRCLSHAFRCNPNSDWWRKVLEHAFTPPAPGGPSGLSLGTPSPSAFTPRTHYSLSTLAQEFSAKMSCEALVDRLVELVRALEEVQDKARSSEWEVSSWQEWMSFADLFYYLIRCGFVSFHEFVDRLFARFRAGNRPRSNHISWVFAHVARVDSMAMAFKNGPIERHRESINKIHWLNSDRMASSAVATAGAGAGASLQQQQQQASPGAAAALPPAAGSPWDILMSYIGCCQILRLWSQNRQLWERNFSDMADGMRKGKEMDDWWKKFQSGKAAEAAMDYNSADTDTTGMLWVISHTMSGPVCHILLLWLRNAGTTPEENMEVYPNKPLQCRFHEGKPLSLQFMLGLSMQVIHRLMQSVEELISAEKVIVNASMLETYARCAYLAPHAMHCVQTIHAPPYKVKDAKSNLQALLTNYVPRRSNNGGPLIVLELINFRFLPFFRFHGKFRGLLSDLSKILISVKKEPGEHRLYRLAENTAFNIILSLRDIVPIKKELRGVSTEFSESLNRLMILNLAMTVKTRGVQEYESLVLLDPTIDQILAGSSHQWSEITQRYFPKLVKDKIQHRPDRRKDNVQGWLQVESSVVDVISTLLRQDQSYCLPFLARFPLERRRYFCAAAFTIMAMQPDASIKLSNLTICMRELSPDDVTSNAYTLADVVVSYIERQTGQKKPLLEMCRNIISAFIWRYDILPLDAVLLALLDRDDVNFSSWLVVSEVELPDLKQHLQSFLAVRGPQESHLLTSVSHGMDPVKALGAHLAGKDRFPVFFDCLALRFPPILQQVLQRLLEHGSLETADRLLKTFSSEINILAFLPLPLAYVRDTLAYFYPLGYSVATKDGARHISVSRNFLCRLVSLLDPAKVPFSPGYLQLYLTGTELPPETYFDALLSSLAAQVVPPVNCTARTPPAPGTAPSGTKPLPPVQLFPLAGTVPQLVLETAAVELLSLPLPAPLSPETQLDGPPIPIVAMLVGAALSGDPRGTRGRGTTPVLVKVQAAGMLLAHLPVPFQQALYQIASTYFLDCPWVTGDLAGDSAGDSSAIFAELALFADPTWGEANGTVSELGGLLSLVHACLANLPFDWLEQALELVDLQRPVRGVAHLRLVFRLVGPTLSRMAICKPLLRTTLDRLFSCAVDVFGGSSEALDNGRVPAEQYLDIVDFLHHSVMLETGHGGLPGKKPTMETLLLCTRKVQEMRPDVALLFKHLTADPGSSIYAATHASVSV